MYSVLDLLPPAQRRAYLELRGYPTDYKPPPLDWQRPPTRDERVESTEGQEREMQLPPGFDSMDAWRRAVRGRRPRRRT